MYCVYIVCILVTRNNSQQLATSKFKNISKTPVNTGNTSIYATSKKNNKKTTFSLKFNLVLNFILNVKKTAVQKLYNCLSKNIYFIRNLLHQSNLREILFLPHSPLLIVMLQL